MRVCLLRGREFALPLWGSHFGEVSKSVDNFSQRPPLSGFKQLSSGQDRARRFGDCVSSPPVVDAGPLSSAGVSGDVQGAGQSQEQARAWSAGCAQASLMPRVTRCYQSRTRQTLSFLWLGLPVHLQAR